LRCHPAALAVHGARGHRPAIIEPPSTTMVWPVIHDAISLARKSAALAMSAGSPMRPRGVARPSWDSLGSQSARAMSVLTRPGAIALTRVTGASSTARTLVRWIRAALVLL